jgi:membrane protein required for colicin V production
MTTLDIILIIPLIWALYSGFKKGILLQLAGIAGIVFGIWLAVRFSGRVGELIGVDPRFAYYGAFVMILIVCMLLLGMFGWLLGKIFQFVGLGILNRLGGVVLSLVKTTLILGVLLIAFQAINRNTAIVDPGQFDRSLLGAPIVRTTRAALPFLKKAVDAIDFSNPDNN